MKLTNQKAWIVFPIGCAGILLASCGGLIFFLVLGVTQYIKSSEPYQHALSVVRSDAGVESVLGQPITDGMMVSGVVKTTGGGGDADLTFYVEGPKGAGSVNVKASRKNFRWQYSSIRVTFDNDARDWIELVAGSEEEYEKSQGRAQNE